MQNAPLSMSRRFLISHNHAKVGPSGILQANYIATGALRIFEHGEHAGDHAHRNDIDQSGQHSRSDWPVQSDCSALDLRHSTLETATESTRRTQPSAPGPASVESRSRPEDHEAIANRQISHDRYSREDTATRKLTLEFNRKLDKRTRTMCKTCRQRKKNCDEGRPVCKFIQPWNDRNMLFLPSLTFTFYRQKVSSRRF